MTDLLDVLDDVFVRPREPRRMRDFAASLKLPHDGGPDQGEPYDPDSHPAQSELLRALDGEPHPWQRIVALGPVQDGKTWILGVVPTMHALFEQGQAIAFVMPTRDKLTTFWQAKFLPTVRGNGLTNQLPTDGAGSEGATPHLIQLPRGGRAYLLSTGTSNEAGLSSITVKVVIGSEVDDIKPARRLDQAWARADRWEDEAVRIEESTIKHDSAKLSRILRDYELGTAARLVFRCPHCRKFTPWDWSRVTYDPLDDATAESSARISCQRCDTLCTQAERRASLFDYRLIHRGQSVADDGTVVGPAPTTRVFSLRWTALDSPLRTLGNLCVRHRQAVQARDGEGDHDKLRQFHRDQLAEPYQADVASEDGTVRLTTAYLAARSAGGWALSRPDKDSHGLYSRHLAPMPAAARRSIFPVDVQDNRVYWALQAEDDDRRIYDVAWGYEYANVSQQPWNDAELHALFDRVAMLAEDLCEHTTLIARTIDVAHWQSRIIPWLQRNRAWTPTAGIDHEVAQGMRRNAVPGVPGVIYLHAPSEWALAGRLLHSIDVQRVREQALNRYLVAPGKPGAAHLPQGLATNDTWIRHQVAQELVELPSGNRVWRKAKGGGRHDYQDLRTYAEALFALYHHRQQRPRIDPATYGVVSNYLGNRS